MPTHLVRDRFSVAQNPLVDGAASDVGTRDVTGALWKAASGRLCGGIQTSGVTFDNFAVYALVSLGGGVGTKVRVIDIPIWPN